MGCGCYYGHAPFWYIYGGGSCFKNRCFHLVVSILLPHDKQCFHLAEQILLFRKMNCSSCRTVLPAELFFLPNCSSCRMLVRFFSIFSPRLSVFVRYVRRYVRPSGRAGWCVSIRRAAACPGLRRGRRNFLRRVHWFRCAMFRGVRHRC